MPDHETRTKRVTPAEGSQYRLQFRKIRVDVIDGPDRGLVAELPGPECRIGTGEDCDLRLKDETVSRLHLVVRIEALRVRREGEDDEPAAADRDTIRILDPGSLNGTILDGIRVRDADARPDSTIAIGATTLRLRMIDDVVELPLSRRTRVGRLLGQSAAMRRVFALIERVAPTSETVLIEGETGTGKELAAEAIHEESRRASGPFIVFDCSAASGALIESELFGHNRGAFTGAVGERAGLFEEADGGTLFLDEIGELPLDLQPRLLRVLERREVRRMGSNQYRRVNVRILAATNRSLSREVELGKFREDLYFRLAVIRLALPPLRERTEDIPLLVRHFERGIAGGKAPRRALSDEELASLASRSWPGNIRELRNAVIRMLSLGAATAAPAAGGEQPKAEGGATPELAALLTADTEVPLLVGRERLAEAYERAYLDRALVESGGNVTRAAARAQVNRKFIQRAMKKYGLRGAASEEEEGENRGEGREEDHDEG